MQILYVNLVLWWIASTKQRYQSINNRTIPIHSSDGSTIESKGFLLSYSSTSSSRRLCSKNGSRSSKFLISTARTLLGTFELFLMLSKTCPIHAVIGTRQSCMPQKLPTQTSFRVSEYLQYLWCIHSYKSTMYFICFMLNKIKNFTYNTYGI